MKRRTVFTTLVFAMVLTVLLIVLPTAYAQSSAPLPNMPTANNTVRAIVPDGAGGVYIGGDFTQLTPASGPAVTRNRIARINADGSIHAWNPNASDTVYALTVSGSTVYAGGAFNGVNSIGGLARNRIAALDATTGTATTWDPNANNTVWALAVSGSTVYAGGDFTTIGGQPRNRIAALDATTGNATVWDPNADNHVHALAVSGSTVYAGGHFTNIGGQPRNYIAALDVAGNATAWNPNANNHVHALAVIGSLVYAGGHFTTIGGQARNRIAALNATTGTATAWNPNANNTVWALAVSGSTVYAGGDFTTIGGQARNRIAALDAAGNATTWNPNASDTVYALAVSGSTVYAGGQFTQIGGQARPYFAAFGPAAQPTPIPTSPAEVPEADTLLLLGGGLGGLATWLRWQWRKRRAGT